MQKPVDVLVEGLGHPEGPDVLPDGRIVFANTYAHEVGVWARDQPKTSYAFTGGGPNACMHGADGWVYVTQSPSVGAWVAAEVRPPSIQRVRPGHEPEVVAAEAGGRRLNAPNDLSFGSDGRLYFTDSGTWDPVTKPDRGYLCVIEPDGRCHDLEELGRVYPNGIVCEPDGSLVWVESYTRNLLRRRPDGSIRILCTFPEEHIPDGLKIDADGNFWIATCGSGGLEIVSPDGRHLDFLESGGVPLNCTFDGAALIVCDAGTTDTGGETFWTGRLLRIEVGVTGMPQFRGSIG